MLVTVTKWGNFSGYRTGMHGACRLRSQTGVNSTLWNFFLLNWCFTQNKVGCVPLLAIFTLVQCLGLRSIALHLYRVLDVAENNWNWERPWGLYAIKHYRLFVYRPQVYITTLRHVVQSQWVECHLADTHQFGRTSRTRSVHANKKEATTNRVLDGSTYPS